MPSFAAVPELILSQAKNLGSELFECPSYIYKYCACMHKFDMDDIQKYCKLLWGVKAYYGDVGVHDWFIMFHHSSMFHHSYTSIFTLHFFCYTESSYGYLFLFGDNVHGGMSKWNLDGMI